MVTGRDGTARALLPPDGPVLMKRRCPFYGWRISAEVGVNVVSSTVGFDGAFVRVVGAWVVGSEVFCNLGKKGCPVSKANSIRRTRSVTYVVFDQRVLRPAVYRKEGGPVWVVVALV